MIKKKFRILFNRIHEPGSIIETVLYVEFNQDGKTGEAMAGKEIETAFYYYFSSKRYTYKRAVELPITSKDADRTNEWFIKGADHGENKIL
jgi:hypothetical protein